MCRKCERKVLDTKWVLDTASVEDETGKEVPQTGDYWTRKFKIYNYKTGKFLGHAFLDTTNTIVDETRTAWSVGILKLKEGFFSWTALSETNKSNPNAFSGAELLSATGFAQGLDGFYKNKIGKAKYDERDRISGDSFRIKIKF